MDKNLKPLETKLTPRRIAEEAARNRKMLEDPVMAQEWVNSLIFRIEEYANNE